MASLNQVQIIGNLGQDPVIRHTADGKAIANFSLATTESWKDKNSGEKKEVTEWHRCVAYEKLAEIVGEYVKKGSQLFVQGALKTRKWTDKDGVEKHTTEITVKELKMIGAKPAGDSNAPPQQRAARPAAKPAPASSAMDDYSDSDIPF
jgi:single-strand DNA-binding protein